jgi:hypothetical protein
MPGNIRIRPGSSARDIWNEGKCRRSGCGIAIVTILDTTPIIRIWVFYWDIGPTAGIYDDKDVAYLRFGTSIPPQVQENSIRLTGWGSFPAGSRVSMNDIDANKPLVPLPIVQVHCKWRRCIPCFRPSYCRSTGFLKREWQY